MSDETLDATGATGSTTERLYAGKYKTIEELEHGYKNAATVYDENSNLKKQLEQHTKIPDAYQNPTDIEIDASRIADIQARAKESGMTQAQYEKFLRGDKDRVEKFKSTYEQAKKDLGETGLNLIQDYVAKNYPKEIAENMIKTFVMNKDARQAALNHRDQLLNSQAPGVGRTSFSSNTVTDADIEKAYAIKEKSKHIKDINRYLNLVAQKAEQLKSA